MAIKCSVFLATSLDGFIARNNGDLDWLPDSEGDTEGDDHGYSDFFAAIDTLVMGRNTYEKVLTFGDWPFRKKVVVLGSSYPKRPMRIADGVEGTSASPAELVRQLEAAGSAHIYVDGGKTIQSFLRDGLISEMTITRIPVLIGEGIPLFGPLAKDIRLLHDATKSFGNGLVQSRYTVLDSALAGD